MAISDFYNQELKDIPGIDDLISSFKIKLDRIQQQHRERTESQAGEIKNWLYTKFAPFPKNRVFSDFVLEMDARFINQGEGTAMIAFRDNGTNHYGANISPQGWVGFHKNVNGELVIALADTSSDQGTLTFGVCVDNDGNPSQVLIDNLKIWDIIDLSP